MRIARSGISNQRMARQEPDGHVSLRAGLRPRASTRQIADQLPATADVRYVTSRIPAKATVAVVRRVASELTPPRVGIRASKFSDGRRLGCCHSMLAWRYAPRLPVAQG